MKVGSFTLVTLAALAAPSLARAYRPFDGTDADVAELGNFELELGPAHYYRQGPDNYVIAPATVLNYGIGPGTEVVVDYQDFVALGPLDGRPGVAFLDTDLLVKHVFREGILQGKSGLSVAAEGGVLSPEYHGIKGVGASVDVITSYRWPWGTLHWNAQPEYSRARHLAAFTSLIAEGPHDWRVRPIAELYYEGEAKVDQTGSLLVGAIWTVGESFVLDAGVRGARVVDQNAVEVRLGFTWAIPLGPTENAGAGAVHPPE